MDLIYYSQARRVVNGEAIPFELAAEAIKAQPRPAKQRRDDARSARYRRSPNVAIEQREEHPYRT